MHAALCADDAELARERFAALFVDHGGEPYVRERYAELVLLADWIDGWTEPVSAKDLVDLGARVVTLRGSSRSIELAYTEPGLEDFLAGDAQDRYHAGLDPEQPPNGDLFLFPVAFTDDYSVRLSGVRRGIATELHVAIQPSGERVVVTFEDADGSDRLIAVQVVGRGHRAPPRTVYVDGPDANSPLLPFELEVEVADGVVTVRHAGKPALELELVGDGLVPGRFGFVAEGVTVAMRRARLGPSFAGPGFDERLDAVRQLFGSLRALEVEGEVDGAWLARTLRGQRLL
ncbi:MAG TPA: hypothetical protein VJP77_08540, partial [Planctomycetota bacterium]|nr:hypothetical protein [Planctomycetota bacterium]